MQAISIDDTICAITTALGGAVGVIRISGEAATALSSRVWHGRVPLSELPPRVLSLGDVRDSDGHVVDPECLAVRMPGPHSYTGEDVVELQCHGGALCVRLTLEALLAAGCRMAEPGEFTRRAFMNGRLDLTQAEAVADVITAGSSAALQMAGRQLKGRLGQRINTCYDLLSNMLADVESRLDFSEEEIDWRPNEALEAELTDCRKQLEALLATRRTGEVLRGGLSLAIVGCPNVGKSSLLNYLLGRDRAIVTDIPGTTRDTIEERVIVRGIPLRLVDTAGIRDGGDDIERTGMQRSQESAEGADIVLWVYDASLPYDAQAWPGWDIRGKLLLVGNKSDKLQPDVASTDHLLVSAMTGAGMEELYAAIEHSAGNGVSLETGDDVAVAARHAQLLETALEALARVVPELHASTWELMSLGLRDAVSALGRIVGRSVEPDVLETIFSHFCIGK